MHKITVISKHGCHLCEKAIQILESLRTRASFELEILYIEDDESLHDSYWLKIPVVRLDGKDIYEAEDIALPSECKEKLERVLSRMGH
ncbi:MAG: glutaredoxin family protein [Nitrososphaerales archaeon]